MPGSIRALYRTPGSGKSGLAGGIRRGFQGIRRWSAGWAPRTVVLSACLAAAAPAGAPGGADWPGWRGPTGQGQSTARDLPLTWGENGQNIRWKSPLPGSESPDTLDQNQSSPIVRRGRVIVTASYWPGGQADPARHPEHHVACYSANDGRRLWDVTVAPGPWLLADLRGGYTAPTPAADEERVYVLFGSSVIAALDFNGRQVWRREIRPYRFDVALGASPVLYRDLVLLLCDQVDRQSRLLALDRKTGAVRWEELRPQVDFSHSTPVLARVGEKTQLLTAASNAVQGIDPHTGRLLWWAAAAGDAVSPVTGAGLVYVDSGRGGTGVAVDPTGRGDVTRSHHRWTTRRFPEGLGSPVTSGELLYRLHSPGVLKCFRWSDGELVYSERLNGAVTQASPVATADGRLYFATAGKSYVVRAGPQFAVLGTSDLGDPSHASPAVSGSRLYVKGRKSLYCIGG